MSAFGYGYRTGFAAEKPLAPVRAGICNKISTLTVTSLPLLTV